MSIDLDRVKKGVREMVELTIKVSPEVVGELKGLQDRVNKNLASAIEEGIERPVNIHRIAAALVTIGLSGSSRGKIAFKRDKITFAVMVAQQQMNIERIANSKGKILYKKSEETRTPKNGDGEK